MPVPGDLNARVRLPVRCYEKTSQRLQTTATGQGRSVAIVVRGLLRGWLRLHELERLSGQVSLEHPGECHWVVQACVVFEEGTRSALR